jgi:hypothetical protein
MRKLPLLLGFPFDQSCPRVAGVGGHAARAAIRLALTCRAQETNVHRRESFRHHPSNAPAGVRLRKGSLVALEFALERPAAPARG